MAIDWQRSAMDMSNGFAAVKTREMSHETPDGSVTTMVEHINLHAVHMFSQQKQTETARAELLMAEQ